MCTLVCRKVYEYPVNTNEKILSRKIKKMSEKGWTNQHKKNY